MPLTSLWFSSNERLQQCLLFDTSHLKSADQGEHVLLVQQALSMLDDAVIDATEQAAQRYGASTARAVLAYKRKRTIVNRAYEAQADDIVGKLTIQALDEEMRRKETAQFQLIGGGAPLLRSVLFAPIITRVSKGVVVTETNAPFFAWAKTFAATFASVGTGLISVPNGASVSLTTTLLKRAAITAGSGGFIVLSVGHGSVGADGFTDEGFFDLAPGHSFQVAGRNAVLEGDAIPNGGGRASQASAFYDFREPNPILKGGFATSRQDDDTASGSAAAKRRLAHFASYEDIGKTFRGVGLSGVIILSCRVGAASGFMKRVRQQWGVPIIGYTRRVVGQDQGNGRTRIFLQGDAPNVGTNTALGEFLFPLAPDMVVF